MDDIRLKISTLVMSGLKNDSAVKYIYDIYSGDEETAVKAYSSLCEILLSGGVTLSEYLYRLTTAADDMMFSEYMRTRSGLLRRNISRDINILAELSGLTSEALVNTIRERFSVPDTVTFPEFDSGNTAISFEDAVSYREQYGNAFFGENKAFIYENGMFRAASGFDGIRLSELKSYEIQRNAVIDNTLRLLEGRPHSNVLLYGDRGTGKSCTVKAVVNEYEKLRIVLVPRSSIASLYDIYDKLRYQPLKFILFLDDMSFEDGDPDYGFLKQALEGSVCVMPDNCAIYATTNRRHIIKETSSERADEHNAADARDEKASLADRFGLYITFMSPDKKTYLDIAARLAADRGIEIDRDELALMAERFAVRKGNRSPRTARQFVDTLEK